MREIEGGGSGKVQTERRWYKFEIKGFFSYLK